MAKQKEFRYFLVKDFQFNLMAGGPRTPAWPYYVEFQNWPSMVQNSNIYGDLTSQNTLPGQNTRPPSEKMFANHVFVSVPFQGKDPYYDPSYGGTYKDAGDFQTKAIDAVLTASESAFSNRPVRRWFLARKPAANGEFVLGQGRFQ